jgi:hypothetical protein
MLSYAEVESTLAVIYRASGKTQAGAFRGRLKHLKRLGIPLGVHPGRGKKISYGRNELYQWCFCLELSEFGIDPSIVTRLVRRYWKTQIFPGFDKMREEKREHYFWFEPEFMSANWSPAREFRGIGNFGWGERSDLPLKGLISGSPGLSAVTKPAGRISIFNLTDRIRQIETALAAADAKREREK